MTTDEGLIDDGGHLQLQARVGDLVERGGRVRDERDGPPADLDGDLCGWCFDPCGRRVTTCRTTP